MRLTQIVCPNCKASLSSKAGIEEGTAVACPKCKRSFAAAAPNQDVDDDFEVVEDDEDAAPAKKAGARRADRDENEHDDASPKKAKPRSNRDEDDDDGQPKAKQRHGDEPAAKKRKSDNDEPAAKKRKNDDDEPAKKRKSDDDERAKPKKKRKRGDDEEELSAYGKLKNNIWVRISVLGLLLAIFGIVVYMFYLKTENEKSTPPVVRNEDEDLAKPIRPDRKGPKGETASKDDSQKLQGAWSAASATSDGEKFPSKGLPQFRFVVHGNIWQSLANARNNSRFKLDSSKALAEIDFVHLPNNVTWLGIYRFVDNDTLEICYRAEPGERPKDFSAPAKSKRLHLVLKRDVISAGPRQYANNAERIRGSWLPTDVRFSTDRGGKKEGPIDDDALSDLVAISGNGSMLRTVPVTFTDDEMIFESSDKNIQYSYDFAKNPNQIDFIHPNGAVSHGILRFRDDNTLDLCVAVRGERPADFGSESVDQFFFTFVRNNAPP
jgi:uncharacterized protein (TIGR03067 family)